jgi:carbon-monoxide dehydrogenase small subunit
MTVPQASAPDEGGQVLPPYVLTVDGSELDVAGARVGDSLLTVLRDRIGLAVVKEGCRRGTCGACAVLVDAELRNACLVLAVTASGRRVTTANGLGGGQLTDVARAMTQTGAVQCGFCIPAMVLAAAALLAERPSAHEAAVREALSGIECRCAGYGRVVEAVLAAARVRAGAGEEA